MEDRDISILTQVAFKEASAQAQAADLDLTDPEGQARFELIFNYLVESLFVSVKAQQGAEAQAGQLIKANFPGTQVVHQHPSVPQQQTWGATPTPAQLPYQQQGSFAQPVGPHNYQLTVKGNQYGAIPDAVYQWAAENGVHEVYDNRDQPPGSRRPMFKSTAGGRDAPAYWASSR
jgi:hypothetical protein